MSFKKDYETIKQQKIKALNKLEKFLNELLNSDTPLTCDKLSYWIEDYCSFLEIEKKQTEFPKIF